MLDRYGNYILKSSIGLGMLEYIVMNIAWECFCFVDNCITRDERSHKCQTFHGRSSRRSK